MLEIFNDAEGLLSLASTVGIIFLTVRAFQNAKLLNQQMEILQRLEKKGERQDRLLAIALKTDVPNPDADPPRQR